MQKLTYLIIATLILVAGLFVFRQSPAFAQNCDADGNGTVSPKEAVQCGACGAAGQPACDSPTATSSLNTTIRNIINILSLVVGIVAVIMIIIAGFRYITSAGGEQTIAAAKRTLIYALIGLVIVVLAQVIARFVLRAATGAPVTSTSSPSPSASPSPTPSPTLPRGID